MYRAKKEKIMCGIAGIVGNCPDRRLIPEMIDLMNQEKIPDAHPSCKNCAYARQRSLVETP